MNDIFLKLVNMSITAGWIVLAVLLLRLALRRAPKWISCLMWSVAALRLVLPVSLESVFSLIPSAETIPPNILFTQTPMIQSGYGVLNSTVNPIISEFLAPEAGSGVNPMQVAVTVAAVIWAVGAAAMLLYGLVSYLKLHRRVAASIRYADNVYFCDDIDSPFILGILRPKIYVPSDAPQEHIAHILSHERAHIRRRDYLWKPIGFALLGVYWFNPLLWAAYILLCRDIESACDERVIRDMDAGSKREYSEALLACSVRCRPVSACPLAFGEVGVRTRIKSILNYKKPAFWIVAAAVAASAVVALCFLTNPKNGLDSSGGEVPGAYMFADVAPSVLKRKDDVGRILSENGHKITEQRFEGFCAAVPTELLDGYTEDGEHTFDDGEMPVYIDETTTLYLKSVTASQSGETLELHFKAVYNLGAKGSFYSPYYVVGGRLKRGVYAFRQTMFTRNAQTGAEIECGKFTLDSVGDENDFSIRVTEHELKELQIDSVTTGFYEFMLMLNMITFDGPDAESCIVRSDSAPSEQEISSLRERYPEYFGLDASQGLVVYTFQYSPYSYDCIIDSLASPRIDADTDYDSYLSFSEDSFYPGTYYIPGTYIKMPFSDGLALGGPSVDMRTARAIIASYGIPDSKVYVAPSRSGFSSCLYYLTSDYMEMTALRFWCTPASGTMASETASADELAAEGYWLIPAGH